MSYSEFASYGKSFAGCAGGNPCADIWVCGIEPGGGYEDYRQLTSTYFRDGVRTSIPADEPDWGIRHRFGISRAKVISAIYGESPENYRNVVAKLGPASICSFNLFPIPFAGDSEKLWADNNLNKVTGIQTKSLYKYWCRSNRFPQFTKATAEFRPKIVIGVGLGHANDFLEAFGGEVIDVSLVREDFLLTKHESAQSGQSRRFVWAKLSDHTSLFVAPFFGARSGLNSNHLLGQFGGRVRTLSGFSAEF